ncbi:MAG: YebC/PmpR family DNA-binding transcriptional regulator [Patescibacteria group bacterium]
MSGHSKWSTIKRQKGVNDQKRGVIFTKLANAISVAVRQDHGVQLAIDKAKAANMPKDNIQRAIDKGAGRVSGAELVEALFEGFGPSGVAIIAEAITDNSARTAAEIRNVFNKNGGHLANPGAVSYMFTRAGEIENETFEKALEVGALDFEDGTLYTKPEDLHKISEVLGKIGSLIFKPNKETMINVTDPNVSAKIQNLLTALDDLDDVQNVYCNANFV